MRVRKLGADRPSVRVLLDALDLKSLDAGGATVVVKSAAKLGSARSSRAKLGELIGEAMGRGGPVEVRVEAAAGVSQLAPAPTGRITGEQEHKALQNPLVRKTVELFDARIVEIKELPNAGPKED